MRVLFVDWSTGHDSVDSVKTGLTGGRVSFLRELPGALLQLGVDCTVWTDSIMDGVIDGVPWIAKENHDLIFSKNYDFLVLMRGTHNGWPEITAKHRILCVRDLPHFGFIKFPKLLNGFSNTVAGSEYAKNLWQTYCKDIKKVTVIPNGVDRETFRPREKDYDYLIYASAPNRGLARIPLQFDMLKNHIKSTLKLKAFSHLGKLHPGEVKRDGYVDGYSQDYKDMTDSTMEWLDPIPKEQLAVELGKACLMLLPTSFPEICSNVVLQSLSCGTPIVTTGNLGATPEWVHHRWNGMLPSTTRRTMRCGTWRW